MERGVHWYNQLLDIPFCAIPIIGPVVLFFIFLSCLIVLILMCPIKLKKMVANLHIQVHIHVQITPHKTSLLTVNIETDIAVDCSIIDVDTVYI